ncbi:MAG: ATP-binding protein [Gemmataceae bacterium]
MIRQVLLVDPSTASVRAEQLRRLGYHVWTCHTCETAWDYAQRRLPDAILIRSTLPAEDRSELIAQIRFHLPTNSLALILEEAAPTAALTIEPDARLAPITPHTALLEALASALAQAERRRHHLIRSEVCWRLQSSPLVLEQFAQPLAHWTQQTGLSPFAAKQLVHAVRELCANAMEWGNHYQPDAPVDVVARLDEEKVSVLIRDSGSGFDRQRLPHAARPGDPVSHLSIRAAANLREGGFGILMASGLVDQLAYNECGNEALAVKYLPHSLTHPLRLGSSPLLASG